MAKDLLLIWLAIGALVAVLVGVAAGVLAWLANRNVATAALTGGAAFGGALTLVVVLIELLR